MIKQFFNVDLLKNEQMYISGQYEEGLSILNHQINTNLNNSILYSNRALFYSKLNNNDQAI